MTHIFFAQWWLCTPVNNIQFDDRTIYAHNGTTMGTWEQRTFVSSCMFPEKSAHAMTVNAY